MSIHSSCSSADECTYLYCVPRLVHLYLVPRTQYNPFAHRCKYSFFYDGKPSNWSSCGARRDILSRSYSSCETLLECAAPPRCGIGRPAPPRRPWLWSSSSSSLIILDACGAIMLWGIVKLPRRAAVSAMSLGLLLLGDFFFRFARFDSLRRDLGFLLVLPWSPARLKDLAIGFAARAPFLLRLRRRFSAMLALICIIRLPSSRSCSILTRCRCAHFLSICLIFLSLRRLIAQKYQVP